jgi:hypothetical protein
MRLLREPVSPAYGRFARSANLSKLYASASSGSFARELLGEVDHHLALLPGGVVLHLAVDHVHAAAVRDRLDHLPGEGDLLRVGPEDVLDHLDLDRVQRPGPIPALVQASTFRQRAVAARRPAQMPAGRP